MCSLNTRWIYLNITHKLANHHMPQVLHYSLLWNILKEFIIMIAFSLCRAWQGDETASIHVSNIVGNVIVIPCFFFFNYSHMASGNWAFQCKYIFGSKLWSASQAFCHQNPSRILIKWSLHCRGCPTQDSEEPRAGWFHSHTKGLI